MLLHDFKNFYCFQNIYLYIQHRKQIRVEQEKSHMKAYTVTPYLPYILESNPHPL